MQIESDVALGQLGFQLHDELLHHLVDNGSRQRRERNDRIQTVAEFRGEQTVDRLFILARTPRRTETDGGFRHFGCARIGRHDEDDVAEVDLLAVMVGQRAMVHHLQQDVVDIRMRLFDFVQQHHGMRVLVDAVGQETTLIEADITGRCAEQTRHGMTFHIFRHVEAQHLDAERGGKLLGHFRLTDARRAGKDIRANRLVRFTQARTRQLDGRGKRLDGDILTVNDGTQFLFKVGENHLVILGDRLRGNAGHRRDGGLDFPLGDQLAALGGRQQHLRRTGLVDHVDRLVRQLAVGNVASRQLDSSLDRLVGISEVVVVLEIGLQPLHDRDGVIDGRLVDVDLLETAHKRAILFEELPIFLIGGRADAADRTRRQGRLQEVRCIHRATRGRARTDDGVDFIDEQNRARIFFEFLDDLLQTLFEITAIAGPGEQRTHVEREDGVIGERLRHLAFDDTLGETFGNRRLAHARIAHIKRVVLGAAAEDLDGAVDLVVAADQRIDLAVFRLFIEVDAVSLQRILLLLGGRSVFLGIAAARLVFAFRFIGTARRARLRRAGALTDAVGDVVDRVVTGHLLLLQEIGGVAFALGENGHKHVRAGHFLAAGRLNMDDGPLDNPLEAGCGFGILVITRDEVRQFIVDVIADSLAKRIEIDIAGAHDGCGIRVVDQRQKEMFQRRIFVVTLICKGQCLVQRLLETWGKSWHVAILISFP